MPIGVLPGNLNPPVFTHSGCPNGRFGVAQPPFHRTLSVYPLKPCPLYDDKTMTEDVRGLHHSNIHLWRQ
jgi:hypothetical protein